MMKLCPIKYGVSMAVPPVPTGNVWIIVDGLGFVSYYGDYTGSTWTSFTNDCPGGIRGTSFRAGSYLYVQNPPYYASISSLGTWTAVAGWSSSNLSGYASDGSYIYIGRGASNVLGRIPYPTGTMTTPNVTSESYANTLCVWGGDLYIFCEINNRVYVSTDAGVNYTAKTEFRTLGVAASQPKAASSVDGIAVAYVDNAGTGPVKITFSDDGATTWSAPANPMPTDTSVVDFIRTPTHFIVFTGSGYTAYSTDGLSWTQGATIPGGVSTAIAQGIGKIVVTNSAGDAYQSTDNAQSWTAFTGPTASDNAGVYWIGDPP